MQLARYRYDIQTPPILSGSPRYFGAGRTYAPGVYRIRYANGAMLYAGGPPLWSVADPLTAGRGFYFRAPDAGVQVFAPQVLNGGGTGQVYATAEECRAAHLLLPPVDLTVPAPSRLTVYLNDDPYWDNTTGPLGPPSWWFVGRVGDVPPAPPTVPQVVAVGVNDTPEGCAVVFVLSVEIVSVDGQEVYIDLDGIGLTTGALDEVAGDSFTIRLDNVFSSQVVGWVIENPSTTIQLAAGTLQEPYVGSVPYP